MKETASVNHLMGMPIMTINYPEVGQQQKVSLHWARKYGLVLSAKTEKNYMSTSSGQWGQYFYGYASYDRRQLGSKLVGWLFCFDDEYPDGSLRLDAKGFNFICRNLIDAYRSSKSLQIQSSFVSAILNLRDEMLTFSNEDWIRRFGLSLESYFHGCLTEIFYRTSGIFPTISEYLDFRTQSIGGYPAIDFMEIACGRILTPQEIACEMMLEYRNVASILYALSNDYFSAPKESDELESFNAIFCIKREHDLTMEEALQKFYKLHHLYVNKMLDLENRLIQKFGIHSGIDKFCYAIKYFAQGNFDCSAQSVRYQT